MTSHDDYRHEVDRLSTEQVEAILGGRDPGDPVAGRALALVGEIRQELVKELPVWVVQRHLTAIAGAHGGRDAGTNRRSRGSKFGRRRLVVAVAAALAMAAGAAAALTFPDRPDQARRPVPDGVRPSGIADTGSPVDVGVPKEGAQRTGDAREGPRSNHGQEVSGPARGTALQGCEKGQAVSERASQKAGGKAHRADSDRCGRSDQGNSGRRGPGRGGRALSHGQRSAESRVAGLHPARAHPGAPVPAPPDPRAVDP